MITPEQRAQYRRVLVATSERNTQISPDFALKLLDALDAAENRAKMYKAAALECQKNAGAIIARADAAEQRVAELVRAVRAVYAADHPINEMHAERALRQLVYKNGGEE